MEQTFVSDLEDVSALREAGWGTLSDRVMRGVCHDINGRAAALASWVDLSEGGRVEAARVESEIGKLTELARVGSALVVGDAEPASPLLVTDVLQEAMLVHRLHRGLESIAVELSVESTPSPVEACWNRLRQVLLLLLADIGWEADGAGARRLHLRLTDGPEGTLLTFGTSDSGERTMAPLEERPLPARDQMGSALNRILSRWGMSVEMKVRGIVLRLR